MYVPASLGTLCDPRTVLLLSLPVSSCQQLVGWYHSHPKFVSDPSPIDVKNHQVHQVSEGGREGESEYAAAILIDRSKRSLFLPPCPEEALGEGMFSSRGLQLLCCAC